MNPPSMESIFLILSGVILAAGILYWFWSHIQLTQKKVQLLENAVFELRGMMNGSVPGPDPGFGPGPDSGSGSKSQPAVYNDLADDDWEESPTGEGEGEGEREGVSEVEAPQQESQSPIPNRDQERDEVLNRYAGDKSVEPMGSTPLEALADDSNDLQPGGRADLGNESNQFRELFVQERRLPTPSTPVVTESLESMPVRELRRLAEQRGLTGVSDLKKKELLAALRQQITSAPSPVKGQTQNVVVERTLDLIEEAPLVNAVEVEAEVEGLDATVLE